MLSTTISDRVAAAAPAVASLSGKYAVYDIGHIIAVVTGVSAGERIAGPYGGRARRASLVRRNRAGPYVRECA
ncbi:hypothetical protein Misp03_53590 [Microbispora sp. NBRC 16548]|nr:hypothetical protein Misp03_53590 [Microbispora sp. NBRC 16548]